MAKLYKVEMYILDINEDYEDIDEVVNRLEGNSDLTLKCYNTQKARFDWDDDIDINYSNCPIDKYRKYFE